jgi:hypothetical protein
MHLAELCNQGGNTAENGGRHWLASFLYRAATKVSASSATYAQYAAEGSRDHTSALHMMMPMEEEGTVALHFHEKHS